MRKQLTLAKLWVECLFQCVRTCVRTCVCLLPASHTIFYRFNSFWWRLTNTYTVIIWMNRQKIQLEPQCVPLNRVCINHTNETSNVHLFSRFKTNRVCQWCVCLCVWWMCWCCFCLLHVICYRAYIVIVSVIIVTFIVLLYTSIFWKPLTFLFILFLHVTCFFIYFIFSYSQIVILFIIIIQRYSLWFESIINLEISSYFCNRLQCRVCVKKKKKTEEDCSVNCFRFDKLLYNQCHMIWFVHLLRLKSVFK